MTSELVLAVLLFSLGLSFPVSLGVFIILIIVAIIVASSFLLQFLDDVDKSNGYGKYHKDNNKS